VSAYALSVLLLKRSVLTEKIARRRLHLTREYTTDPLETFFAHEVMTRHPTVLRADDVISAVLPRIRHATLYPVTDDAGRMVGVTYRRALLGATGETVADAAVAPRVLTHPDDTLREVANKLAAGHVTRAPVVDRGDPGCLCGVITLPQLLHARRRDLHEEHHRERLLTARPENRVNT
jgi:CBS-domain-containing membrane protein